MYLLERVATLYSDSSSESKWEGTHKPPQVGYALTISAILAPSVKHIEAPRIQHHTTYRAGMKYYGEIEEVVGMLTVAGPPSVRGVLNVVAILEQRPYSLLSVQDSFMRRERSP